jgi:hypothetical protein
MNHLTAGLIVVIGILGGFYVGAKYGQGHPTTTSSAAAASTTGGGSGAFAGGAGGTGGTGGTGAGGGGGAGAGGFGNATVGQITAVNGDTITIHDARNNRDVTVNVSSARISKTTDGSPSDLTQNQTVTVVGQAGSDGTVTATVISIGGGANAFGGAGGRRGGASPSPGT